MELGSLLATLEISEALDEHSYVPQVQSYIGKLVANIDHRFPQLHLTSLFGYFDPRNVHHGNLGAMLELAEHFHMDGAQLWSEFLVYRSFAKNLHLPSGMTPIHAVSKAILAPAI